MKKTVSRVLVLAIFAGFGLVALASAEDGAWSGWVTDDHCAAAGAKAAHKDCAAKCVKEKGAKVALYDAHTKATFILSGDDEKMLEYAGQEVTVQGTMDKAKKTIKVTSMEPMVKK